MKKALSVYGTAYLVLIVIVLALLCLYPKLELHLMLNAWHNSTEDTFFKYYTIMAEWPLYLLALLPLCWKKYGMTVFFAVSELSAGLLLQILKHLFNSERPICLFEKCQDMVLPLVEGVDMHHSNSFPSGHASTFFVFYTCAALILAYYYQQKLRRHDHRRWFLINASMLLLVTFAALGAYSRIYLSQHFLSDVCMGSIIGFITPCVIFYFFRDKLMKLNK